MGFFPLSDKRKSVSPMIKPVIGGQRRRRALALCDRRADFLMFLLLLLTFVVSFCFLSTLLPSPVFFGAQDPLISSLSVLKPIAPSVASPDQLNVLILKADHNDTLFRQPHPSPYFSWIIVDQTSLPNYHDDQVLSHLHQTFVRYQPVMVVTLGERALWIDRKGLGRMPYNFRRLWLHYNSVEDFPDDATLTDLFIGRQSLSKKEPPLISVITATYKSGHRLERPYQSLLAQSYDYWEWILWDDSPPEEDNNETYVMLQGMAAKDMRIQVYKAPEGSGSIGKTKFRAASMALGEWIVELDHDDRLATDLFKWIKEISQTRPNTNFIYSDHVELYEDKDAPFNYGEYYGFYYGSYMRQHLRSHEGAPLQPQYISRAPWANPTTLTHLAGLPNHVRIWRRSFYEGIGRHNVNLMVADDYELLLKTFMKAEPGEVVCIAAPSYFQYRNKNGNNFTVKRNALIQHLVWHLHKKWQKSMSQRYKELGWEESKYDMPSGGVWESSVKETTPRLEYYYDPEDSNREEPCVSIVITTYNDTQRLQRLIHSVVAQSYANWKVFVIGDGCPDLDDFATQDFPVIFPEVLSKLYWFNLGRSHQDEGVTARDYAMKMLIKTKMVICLDDYQTLQMWETRREVFLESLVEDTKRNNTSRLPTREGIHPRK